MSADSTLASVEADKPEPLSKSLLELAPVAVERRKQSPWAYPLAGVLFASMFVLYHLTVLLVWNTPNKSFTKQFHTKVLKGVKGYEYFRGTRNNQSWAMFAPNPTRTNAFIRVIVEDFDGNSWDFHHDIWKKDRYPYIWYDRGGKVNRRIDNKKTYQRMYGAWVCREWERNNDGQPAKSVQFIKRWTHVPEAKLVIKKGGWDQWAAPMEQKEQETITCKTVTNGQLSNELRGRYDLDALEDEKMFLPVKSRSWWDKAEAERAREEKQAERDAARARREAARGARIEAAASAKIGDARGPLRDPAPDDDESPSQ